MTKLEKGILTIGKDKFDCNAGVPLKVATELNKTVEPLEQIQLSVPHLAGFYKGKDKEKITLEYLENTVSLADVELIVHALIYGRHHHIYNTRSQMVEAASKLAEADTKNG